MVSSMLPTTRDGTSSRRKLRNICIGKFDDHGQNSKQHCMVAEVRENNTRRAGMHLRVGNAERAVPVLGGRPQRGQLVTPRPEAGLAAVALLHRLRHTLLQLFLRLKET